MLETFKIVENLMRYVFVTNLSFNNMEKFEFTQLLREKVQNKVVFSAAVHDKMELVCMKRCKIEFGLLRIHCIAKGFIFARISLMILRQV